MWRSCFLFGWIAALPAMAAQGGFADLTQEFETFADRQRDEFMEFADKADAEFSEWLAQAWQEYRRLPPYNRDLGPKPATQPVAPSVHRPAATDSLASADDRNKEKPAKLASTPAGQVSFYGQLITVPVWPQPLPLLDGLAPKRISAAWRALASADYHPVVDALTGACRQLACGDWAQLLLVRDYGEWMASHAKVTPSQQALLQWFLLDKLGLHVRGARFVPTAGGVEQLVVLYRPAQRVYGQPFFAIDGDDFFPVQALPEGRLLSYPAGFAPAANYSRRATDLRFARTLSVPDQIAVRELTPTSDASIALRYSDARRRYLDVHPQVDLKHYFAAPVDPVLAQSIREAFAPHVADLSSREAAQWILRTVQYGVPYALDETQFGAETYLLPEQLLYYPAADCEDRSLFYAALVRTLLEVATVGVVYPNHVATAVALPETPAGDAITYAHNDNLYWLADPTYLGASLGELMPRYSKADGKLIAN